MLLESFKIALAAFIMMMSVMAIGVYWSDIHVMLTTINGGI